MKLRESAEGHYPSTTFASKCAHMESPTYIPKMRRRIAIPPPEARKPIKRKRNDNKTKTKLVVEKMKVMQPPYLRKAIDRPMAIPITTANRSSKRADIAAVPDVPLGNRAAVADAENDVTV